MKTSKQLIFLAILAALSLALSASITLAGPTESRESADAREKALKEKIAANRASYRPVMLTDKGAARQEYDLSGKWLFMPGGDIADNSIATDAKKGDENWHTLGVPQFWQPINWWIYTAAAGTSHNYMRKEAERCSEFTFNWGTRAGWYRHWVEVPKSFEEKRLVLRFDAVSNIAEVYWNGKRMGSHIGMFAPFECEVTANTRFGEKNLLAVYVASGNVGGADADKVVQIAVTVPVTKGMLNGLPRGCYWSYPPGIWQPVKLIVSGQDRVADVYFKPRLDGASIETTLDRKTAEKLELRQIITDAATGKVYARLSQTVTNADKKPVVTGFSFGKQKPKFWSPEHPNLYKLKTQIVANNKVVDEKITTTGFKVFEARGNKLYLNGKPYFMRGSDQPPHGIEPNNKPLADKFMKLMHDGNLMTTRFHVAPPPQFWLDAADKYGVGSSVGETWPWIFVGNTALPDQRLLKVWKDEFLDLVRENRNHPSLMLWTLSNESFTNLDPDKNRRLEKEKVFSDLVQAVRKTDPKTPVVLHSGYVRYPDYYKEVLAPNHVDDGDIDDLHCYNGWYNRSPFRLNMSELEKCFDTLGTSAPDRHNLGRPLISQEASTGYPDNDTGHAVEQYIKYHQVPQAWIGHFATYEYGPETFLNMQAMMTKEMCEKIRRERTLISGWELFATTCWFKDVYDPERMIPYPVYWEARKGWQPVLVSMESAERHFEAGESFKSRVFVIHDDPDRGKLTNLTLTWKIFTKSNDPGTSGTVKMPDCEYDKKSFAEVEFTAPKALPLPRIPGTLVLELRQGDKVISRNDYRVILATKDFYAGGNGRKLTVVESGTRTGEYFKGLGLGVESVKSVDWAKLDKGTLVVLAGDADPACTAQTQDFQGFINGGGRVLMLGTDSTEKSDPRLAAIPGIPADQVKTVYAEGDFADVLEPELIAGMDPMDMHWWRADPGDAVRVCRTAYRVPDSPGVTKLATYIMPHGYLAGSNPMAEITAWPAFEVKQGSGRVIVSSMIMANEPLAKRFYRNLTDYISK